MAGNQNVNQMIAMMHSQNASNSTISTRSTLSHASNQSQNTTTNLHQNFNNQQNNINRNHQMNNQGQQVQHNNNNGHQSSTQALTQFNQLLNGNSANTNAILAAAQASNGNNNGNNVSHVPGINNSQNGGLTTTQLGQLTQQFNNNGFAGGPNNGNPSGSVGGTSSVGAGSISAQQQQMHHQQQQQHNNITSIANSAGFGPSAQVSHVGLQDINMGNQNAMEAGTSEIQKFAEQSRNHGKMIEFFIENHLPPLMKTDKLIKELGKMDFDTFQSNYQSNNSLADTNYGFEFEHLNRNNDNKPPSLEKDHLQEIQILKQQLQRQNNEVQNLRNQLQTQQNEVRRLKLENNGLNNQVNQLKQTLQQQQRVNQQQQQQTSQQQQQQSQQHQNSQRNDISMTGNSNSHNSNNHSQSPSHLQSHTHSHSHSHSHSQSPGPLPNYSSVKYIKSNDDSGKEILKCTDLVDQLRKEIQKRKDIDESNWNIEADKEFNPYLDPILNYLMHNEENKLHPDLTLGGGGNKKDGQPGATDGSGNEEEEPTTPQNELIEIFQHNDNTNNKSLIGQNGLRTKQILPKNTVLGQYCGVEYLKNEYTTVFGHTGDMYRNKLRYSYNLEITMPRKKAGDNNTPDMWANSSIYNVIIDALFKNEDNNNNSNNISYERSMLTYINDCRKDISKLIMTNEDINNENVKFVKVYVNGWPMIFVVTCKDIQIGNELLAYYGTNYDLNTNINTLNNTTNTSINNNNNQTQTQQSQQQQQTIVGTMNQQQVDTTMAM